MTIITKKAFSLIEVVVATSIITISVFWVYKLISENTKIINNSWNLLRANSLFPNIKECINYINNDFTLINWYSWNIYFWDSLTWCSLTSTWINNIDNIEYIINTSIVWTWSNYTTWKINIKSDNTIDLKQFYRQIK